VDSPLIQRPVQFHVPGVRYAKDRILYHLRLPVLEVPKCRNGTSPRCFHKPRQEVSCPSTCRLLCISGFQVSGVWNSRTTLCPRNPWFPELRFSKNTYSSPLLQDSQL
jgi:hypothetical protein